MLPGFNSNDQFMAIEGFTNSFHNRSDEAFTVSDLEEFQAANNIELPSVSNNTVNKKPQNKTGLSKQNIDEEVNSEEELNDNELNTTTTRPATTKTTRPVITKTTRPATTKTTQPATTTTTGPATARTTTTRATTARTTTTRAASTKTTTTNKMLASNVDEETEEDEYFKDLNPETNDTNTTEMEDPVMEDPEMEETDSMIETPTEEENIESEMNEKLSGDTGKNNSVMEGFTGSRLIDEKWLNTLLKSLLLTFMVYVLIHPSTGKVLTKFFSKSALTRDLIASGIFFVVCYIVIMVF